MEALRAAEPANEDYAAVKLSRALGTSQHHDAITGTAKEAVDDDYQRMLSEGDRLVVAALADRVFSGLSSPTVDLDQFHACPQLTNVSECSWTTERLSDGNNLVLAVYNPASFKRDHVVRLPLKEDTAVWVRDPLGFTANVQYVAVSEQVQSLPGREGGATKEAVFTAVEVPPMGYALYYIEFVAGLQTDVIRGERLLADELSALGAPAASFKLGFYEGTQDDDIRNSGAYIFRPKTMDVAMWLEPEQAEYVGTAHFTEYRFSTVVDWASYFVRQYPGQPDFFELEWQVGPIPVDDDQGREVIVRYTAESIANDGVFYTDANGRQMIKRERNKVS